MSSWDSIKDDFDRWQNSQTFKDLAPDIYRQRLVIEGTLHNVFKPGDMKTYCKEISRVLDMHPISEPETSFANEYGWCCFMHWKESGMHIYSWDHRKPPFFSVDIYTCKEFAWGDAVRYTEQFFGDNLIQISCRPDGGKNGSRRFDTQEDS